MPSVRISLVLATVDRDEAIAVALDSFARQTQNEFEIVVVDQNDDDRLAPYLAAARAKGLSIHHVRARERGLAKARNLGLQFISGDIVAFPDDDCWYEPDVVENVLRLFDGDRELSGIVGRWVEHAAGRERSGYSLSLQAWRNFRGGDAPSITLFLKRSVLQETGGFDPLLGVGQWFGAAEETDLILCALAAGKRLIHEPSVKVHHHFDPSAKGELKQMCRSVRSRARGTGAIYAKHALSALVIARGFIAPTLKSFRHGHILRGISTSLGRMEGYVAWRRKASRKS